MPRQRTGRLAAFIVIVAAAAAVVGARLPERPSLQEATAPAAAHQ